MSLWEHRELSITNPGPVFASVADKEASLPAAVSASSLSSSTLVQYLLLFSLALAEIMDPAAPTFPLNPPRLQIALKIQ